MKKSSVSPARSSEVAISFKGYRFPPGIISYAVWLYYRFPLSLRMVEEMLAGRGIELTYETVRCWATKFGLTIGGRIRSTSPRRGDKWHLDEGVVTIHGKKHWLWRAVDEPRRTRRAA
ncbi:transposase [Pandoraea sputorum]|uniref:Transposase n=1 Tax=Pandoraea sputorum TaxID=93222 RepID=A0A5E5BJ55_9BURK|nr:transposase [Pandoraea sputorum]